MGFEWIPTIQGSILLAGLYFGISMGLTGLNPIMEEGSVKVKAMLLPSVFAFLVIHIELSSLRSQLDSGL